MAQTASALPSAGRIQLVEDEALIAMDLKGRVQSLGYTVTSIAATAEDAICQAVMHTPDLILMDIHLKGRTDGIQAAEEIRKTLDVPIVYLTAHADSVTIARARITGPFGYITKPFETANLRAQIEMAFAKHQTEHRLRQSEAWLSTTLRNIGDAVIATDRAGRIEFMNPVAEALTGWTTEAAVGEFAFDVCSMIDPVSGGQVANPVLQVLAPEGLRAFSGEYKLRSLTGSVALVQIVVSANKNQDGALLGLVIIVRDITRQRGLEQRTQESHNMETISAMAGGLASDFKNLLTIILGYTDIAKSDPSRAPDALEEIRQAGESAAVLCRQLSTISRTDVVVPESFNLNEAIIASARMLRQILGPSCSLVLNACSGILPIISDRAQIQQLLINLAIHAREAMPEGGTLTITTSPGSSGLAEIRIRDTGTGMTDEMRRRIFEPFFSEKGGSGAGLGMTIVHSIVLKWSGTIEVESQPDVGTEFRMSFPLADAPTDAQAGAGETRREADQPATGRILLVEDNTAIRNLLRRQLEACGFGVVAASCGEEALVFLDEHHEKKIDLLISDVVMPGMTGPELAKRCLDSSPETGVLFMSDHEGTELANNELLQSGRAECVSRPVKPGQLTSAVRKMLERAPYRG